jgi:hypothetical protein
VKSVCATMLAWAAALVKLREFRPEMNCLPLTDATLLSPGDFKKHEIGGQSAMFSWSEMWLKEGTTMFCISSMDAARTMQKALAAEGINCHTHTVRWEEEEI